MGPILVLNAGSSSLKFALFALDSGAPVPQVRGRVEVTGGDLETALADSFDRMVGAQATAFTAPIAIGHRIVMGGVKFVAPVLIDAAVLADIEALAPLAPLHQPAGLTGIREAARRFPGTPQVACFDTALHRNHPFVSDAYALPRRFYDEGIRRFGFHGLSYEYIALQLRARAPQLAAGRVIVAHLGNGASLCAMRDGQSIESTMGFSTLDGLPMGSRSGQIDPGVLLWLMQAKGMSANEVSDLLYKESGLKALSGLSGDLRDLQASDSPQARQAIDYLVYRIQHEIGALAAGLGGLDALVFTGGIGEHSALVRDRVMKGLGWLGLQAGESATGGPGGSASPSGPISAPRSRVAAWVIETDEEAMIARHTARLLGPDAAVAPVE